MAVFVLEPGARAADAGAQDRSGRRLRRRHGDRAHPRLLQPADRHTGFLVAVPVHHDGPQSVLHDAAQRPRQGQAQRGRVHQNAVGTLLRQSQRPQGPPDRDHRAPLCGPWESQTGHGRREGPHEAEGPRRKAAGAQDIGQQRLRLHRRPSRQTALS